jgi:homoaconitase/3-isopropylmalate dehydratase large subunit
MGCAADRAPYAENDFMVGMSLRNFQGRIGGSDIHMVLILDISVTWGMNLWDWLAAVC